MSGGWGAAAVAREFASANIVPLARVLVAEHLVRARNLFELLGGLLLRLVALDFVGVPETRVAAG